MNLWNYYNNKQNQLKYPYPNIFVHTHEKEIAKTNPKWAFDYVSKHGKDEELERIISTSTYHSYWYARYVLNEQPFPLGEKAITKSSEYSYLYAAEVLKKSFKMGEPAIAKEASYSYFYAKNILKGSFALGEPAIAKDAEYSYMYARDILKGPFKLGEKAIAGSPSANEPFKIFFA
jgi:hypothetical protein